MNAMCKIGRKKQKVLHYIGHLKGKGRGGILKPPPSYQPEPPSPQNGAVGSLERTTVAVKSGLVTYRVSA